MQPLEKEALPSNHLLIYNKFRFSKITEMNQIPILAYQIWKFYDLWNQREIAKILLEYWNES